MDNSHCHKFGLHLATGFLTAFVLTLCGASCAPTTHPQPSTEVAEQLAKIDPSQIPLAEFGRLPVFITDQTTDGRNIHLRGLLINPYPEPVEGVRLIFRILPSPDAHARELDRFQKFTDDRIASGGRTALRWDLQTMYAGQGGMWGFDVEAFASRRGGKDLPLPPGWRE